MAGDNLIGFVYKNYPYYAINSKIINRVCDSEEQAKIQKSCVFVGRFD
jgi:hypothetical protein